MKLSRFFVFLACAATVLAGVHTATADVFNMPAGQKSVQFVTVGDPGNAKDTVVPSNTIFGTDTYGSVNYVYDIGKFDVTTGQYTQFLNAVAANDTYGLYASNMAVESPKNGIRLHGSAGSHTYTVDAGYENFPVTFISWGDAARFCNWLQNGQPIGAEVAGVTETGAYALNGATTHNALSLIARTPGARYYLPTEDEWYKAAYYKAGSTNAGYWLYPTQSDVAPLNTLPDTGNHANFRDSAGVYTDPIHLLTDVGAFNLSPGAYGTFDQGGNVINWTDTIWINTSIGYVTRVDRGSSYAFGSNGLTSDVRGVDGAEFSVTNRGFRIVRESEVPEPITFVLTILAFGSLMLQRRRIPA